MNNLERYFQGDYIADSSELRDIASLIESVLPTFGASQTDGVWGYALSGGNPNQSGGSYSISTNGMILQMLIYASGRDGIDVDPVNRTDFVGSKLGEFSLKNALAKYIEELTLCDSDIGIKTVSKTYGINDPFTLSWAVRLLKYHGEPSSLSLIEKICAAVKGEFSDEQKVRGGKIEFFRFHGGAEGQDGMWAGRVQNVHPLPALKIVKMLKEFQDTSNILGAFFDYFEQKLHTLLSYKDIPDARFDPAELAFCLEGALICKEQGSLSEEAVARALSVLKLSQDTTPSWRPINPLYSTNQGQILLPLSIEVANSILRICAHLQENPVRCVDTAKYIKMLGGYYKWLKA